VLLGTSGWSYKEWIGPFYSKQDKSLLRAYTKVFNTVEIDSTFYRYPSRGIVMGWTKYSPEGFVFTAKLPRRITHEKKLDLNQGVEKDLQEYTELMEPLSLSGKLGCVLIQLPPKFDYRPKEMEDFLKILPTHIRFAVEFRDNSWMRQETWPLLQKYKVACTNVDEPLLPPDVHITSSITYFRWHGHGTRPWYDYRYHPEELEPWVPKLQQSAMKVEKTFGYFNNHYHGYAVENCLQILEMLGFRTIQQTIAKRRIQSYLNMSTRTMELKLDAFGEPKETSFKELLRYFTAAGRLERAQDINDDELAIIHQTNERVEAVMRNYHITNDLKDHTISHDCADWSKILTGQKLCKHIAKLLLALDRGKATEILRELHARKGAWQFRLYTGE
jgi:uncharacterized protein YecE (DUF72 family)